MSNYFHEFKFEPASWVPYRDVEVLDMCRKKKREDYLELNNKFPNLNVQIIADDFVWWVWAIDMFKRIKESDEQDKKLVMILPNPTPIYANVAYMINKFNINCRNLYTFNMDEWANQDANVAPIDYPQGFMYAFNRFFYSQIKSELRPPKEQCIGPNNKNIKDYSKMIEDAGEADIVYSACGWSGHTAFIDPVPEFGVNGNDVIDVDEWIKMGARIAHLHPLTIAQNCLHASFGKSGDVAFVPPMAATIGPRDIVNAKRVLEMHFFKTGPTDISWERFISRLVLFGPVTPLVPDSLIQLTNADVYICDVIAQAIEIDMQNQY
ncbi:MAG: hypothetical protein M1475_04915 [Actinobacteria bacterium]|nr:hypothetical protein [Actinomycetota bacterium]